MILFLHSIDEPEPFGFRPHELIQVSAILFSMIELLISLKGCLDDRGPCQDIVYNPGRFLKRRHLVAVESKKVFGAFVY
jgi:hypothetical protein